MNSRPLFRHPVLLCAVLAGVGLAGCGQSLMQTPVIFDGAQIDPFARFDASQRTNEVRVFYATNRPAAGTETDRRYTNGIRNELALGEATVRLGGNEMTWEELYRISTSVERPKAVRLHLENATELALLRPADGPDRPSAAALDFAERINSALARKRWKDITIYIHGAKVDFHHACVTAAEFHHFMGRHGVMLAFDWPSTQSLLTYGTDVKRARMSVSVLARFLEFLAANTDADRINLIGYSCGAQVLSPALVELRRKYEALSGPEIQEKLRIGEVYFAAPDIGMRTFALEHVPTCHDMALSTTLTVNLEDSVLGLAQMAHAASRAGRPDVGELDEEESLMVVELVNLPHFNVIDMGTSQPPTEANLRGHGYWYKSPWVSSDIIIQFIFHASPGQRGLEIDTAPHRKAHVWYYPSDYPHRVVSRLKAYLATLKEGEPAVPVPQR
jgi:esterase/lipase superfamily enzyme